MTARRLNRNELARFFNNDPRAIREFERVLADVQANISGPSIITLNYASDGTLTSPLPLTQSYTLTPESGTAYTSGVSWGVTVLSGSFTGTGPTMGGTGTGILQINSGLASPSALIAVTAHYSAFYNQKHNL
jgi:spore coat protein U-like protein